jgi:transcriptional regulator with XRE-family HTH domain
VTGVAPKSDIDLSRVPKGGPGHVRWLLGQAIQVRREKAKLTQERAAELLGISARTLIRWEKGEGSLWTGGPDETVDYEMMRKLREVYRASWNEIMPRNQYPSAPLDPVARREFFIRRNALIQGFDPDEAVERIMGRERSEPIAKGK